jgi:ATP-dependent 26S proteasome regulatory subunit
MMVEKVPDSTYEAVGGLDEQIKEIKEVIELPRNTQSSSKLSVLPNPNGSRCTALLEQERRY